MSQVAELRKKANKLHALQWTKKQQLRQVIRNQSDAIKEMNRDAKRIPFGDKWVSFNIMKLITALDRCISELTKDMNDRRREINNLESQIMMIKMYVSKNIYLQNVVTGEIIGIHAGGFKGPDGGFFQEEIWANNYRRTEYGELKMIGGSMRVHSQFEEVANDYKTDVNWKEVPEKI